MKRGALVNLLLGSIVAFLPLYTRVSIYDFNRTSKDNLLIFIFGVLSFLLPDKKRNIPALISIACFYAIFSLVLNQWNVLSINVMMQSFYALSGIVFFIHFFEKHEEDSLRYIINGMQTGAIIQAVLIISWHFGYDAYFNLVNFVSGGGNIYVGDGGAIGSLGNTNLSGSYLALTSISFLNSKNKWFLIPSLYALALTKSYMGVGAFSAGTVYFYFSESNVLKKWKLYLFAMAGMFSVYMLKVKNGGSGRFQAWEMLFSKVSLKHFFIGMGPGWFPDQRFKTYDGGTLLQEHNSFLTAFNLFGVVLFLILTPVFIKFIKQSDKNKIFASVLFASFCNSFGHFTLHQSTVAVIIVIAGAICLGDTQNE